MKKNLFIALFFGVNVFFVFFHIHKQSRIITLSYQKQKNEKSRDELIEQKKELQQQLYALRNHALVNNYAHTTLKMEKVRLSAVKTLGNQQLHHDAQ